MTVRMTNILRTEILERVLQQTFGQELDAFRQRIKDLALVLHRHALGDEYEAIHAAPRHWFEGRCVFKAYVLVDVIAQRVDYQLPALHDARSEKIVRNYQHFEADDWLRWTCKAKNLAQRREGPTLTADEAADIGITAFVQDAKDFCERVHKTRAFFRTRLAGCRTVADLLTNWPESRAYLPAEAISPPKRLPVPIFDGACALIETGGRVEVAPS